MRFLHGSSKGLASLAKEKQPTAWNAVDDTAGLGNDVRGGFLRSCMYKEDRGTVFATVVLAKHSAIKYYRIRAC